LAGSGFNLDTITAFLTATRSILINDPELIQIMGKVRVRYDWGEKDEGFPYIVHRYQFHRVQSAVRVGRYFVNMWDYNDTADRVLAMRDRFITLFDERSFSIDNLGQVTDFTCEKRVVDAIRFFLGQDEPIDEGEQNIWRQYLTFEVRYGRSREIRNIEARIKGGE